MIQFKGCYVHTVPAISIVFTMMYTSSMSQGTYKAAVVEYAPIRDFKQLPRQVVETNAEEYVRLIGDAGAKGANLIIFPEYGLTTLEVTKIVSDHLDSYSIEIPDIMHNPCNNSVGNYRYHKVIRNICRAASRNNIYVVIHIVEKLNDLKENKFKYFSTSLVFDRNGTIITRYRKINLCREQNFSSGAEKMKAFKTDFGVTFGLFAGADILHQNSTALLADHFEVTDVIYSTAWNSEMPFLNGLSLQDGFGKGNNVNLLAACLNEAVSNSTGSGIFLSNGYRIVHISSEKKTKMLIRDVPIRTIRPPGNICEEYKEDVVPPSNDQPSTIHTLIENLENYTMEDIGDKGDGSVKLCNGDFCCFFSFIIDRNSTGNFESKSNYLYKLVAFFGSRRFGSRSIGVSVCTIVACANNMSCGRQGTSPPKDIFQSIVINATYSGCEDVYVQPLSAKFSLHPSSNFRYCKSSNNSEINVNISTLAMQDSLLTFGFYSRIYSNDNLPAGRLKYTTHEQRKLDIEDSSNTNSNLVPLITISIPALLLFIIVFIVLFKYIIAKLQNSNSRSSEEEYVNLNNF